MSDRPPLGSESFDDEESPDATSPLSTERLDVTPRTAPAATSRPSGGRRVLTVGAVVLVVGALGFVLFNGLNDAALFYYNVDEALDMRDELADKRFRMQGNVIEGSISETPTGVDFVIAFGDAEVPVHHRGAPPELFSPEIPVIIEGRFDDAGFASDEILIRHDNTYTEEHEDRLQDAEDDVRARTESAG